MTSSSSVMPWRTPWAPSNRCVKRSKPAWPRGASSRCSRPSNGSGSVRSHRARPVLVRAGLPEPELNQPVYAAGHRWLGRPDMRWVEQRVLLEYQGREFHDSDEQRAQDKVRFGRFNGDGWTIVEVWDTNVNTDAARVGLVLNVAEELEHPVDSLNLTEIHPRFFSTRMLELAEIRARRLRAQGR